MYLRVSAFIWCPALSSGNSNNPLGFGTLELLLEALAAGCIFTGCEATASGPLQACALGGGCGCFVTCVCGMPAPEDFEAGGDGGNSFGFGAGGFAGGCNGAFTGGGSAKSGGAGSIGSTCSGGGGSAFAAALAVGKGRYALNASSGISLGQHSLFISSSAGLSVAIWGKLCSHSRVCLKNVDVWLSGSSP